MKGERSRRAVFIQVSEPWDFDIPGRNNLLDATIEGVCHGPNNKNWEGEYLLLSLPKSFIWKGEPVKQLLVAPRAANETIDDLKSGKDSMIGIARVKPGFSLKASQPFAVEQVDYFAIGSIQSKH